MQRKRFDVRSLPRVIMLVLPGLIGMAQASPAWAQTGEELFKANCSACHTVGGGRLVGPDLAGVGDRRAPEWIVRFVQGSQAMVKAGDETAVALFKEYASIPMPDQPLTEAQVLSIVEYARGSGAAAAAMAPPPAQVAAEPTQADIEHGQALFQGKARPKNGGPSCNSCHEVVHDAVIGGGVLARELTTVFGRLGGPGVRSIIGAPPFPVMQRAYLDKPLTPEEVSSLVAFLQFSDRNHALQQPRDYGPKLAASGAGFTALLLGFYTVLWRGRKRQSVYQAISDRQITSSN